MNDTLEQITDEHNQTLADYRATLSQLQKQYDAVDTASIEDMPPALAKSKILSRMEAITANIDDLQGLRNQAHDYMVTKAREAACHDVLQKYDSIDYDLRKLLGAIRADRHNLYRSASLGVDHKRKMLIDAGMTGTRLLALERIATQHGRDHVKKLTDEKIQEAVDKLMAKLA